LETLSKPVKNLAFFEKYLTLWVLLCIVAGIIIGKLVPSFGPYVENSLTFYRVSLPIAICLFFMMFPIMVKIDFSKVLRAGKTPKPVLLTLAVNWLIKPFTMFGIAYLFLGVLFKDFIPGFDVLKDGSKVLMWRSYISGTILLGIAPCTAMVLMWGYLAKGNDAHTLVMVAINSLTMLFFYAPLGGWLLGNNSMPIPWETMLFSVSIYVALPLLCGYYVRKIVISKKGEEWFKNKFLHYLTPVSIIALLFTLILLFSFKGELILNKPQSIFFIAVPLIIQTLFIFFLGYFIAKLMKLRYEDAAPSAMIGASNHFEVAIATAATLYGISSGAALATVVGVLIEVPLMLFLVRISLRTSGWFKN
jgi:ACR3 family arsenite transporter